jgi:hypothetical protein
MHVVIEKMIQETCEDGCVGLHIYYTLNGVQSDRRLCPPLAKDDEIGQKLIDVAKALLAKF